MEIGTEKPAIVIEPLEEPVPSEPEPEAEPVPVEAEPEPVEVPVPA